MFASVEPVAGVTDVLHQSLFPCAPAGIVGGRRHHIDGRNMTTRVCLARFQNAVFVEQVMNLPAATVAQLAVLLFAQGALSQFPSGPQ
jgi:hypothetical protein